MEVKAFFDEETSTLTYLVWKKDTRDAVVIDPVWNYDFASGRLSDDSIKQIVSKVKEKNLKVHFILESHAHADHISGACVLKEKVGGIIAISEKISDVQKIFAPVFQMNVKTDGSQFDLLLKDGHYLSAGDLSIKVIHTPGHTPACASFLIEDCLFTGDALFMPDFGTGRCDFPGGSAETLYQSVHEKIYKLPDDTRIFVGHDYLPGGRSMAYKTSVRESKLSNIHLKSSTSKESYVAFRTSRDKTLKAPKLLLPSIQINIVAGNLPEKDTEGKRFLKIPLKTS